MVTHLSEMIRDAQILRLQYERMIQICESLLRPSGATKTADPLLGDNVPEREPPSSPVSSSSPSSLICSEIDKVLESARQLTLTDNSSRKVGFTKPHPQITTKASIKKAKAIYGPTQDKSTSRKPIHLPKQQQKEAVRKAKMETTPTIIKHPKGDMGVKWKPLELEVDVEGSGNNDSRLVIEKISNNTFPLKYKKLKRTITELINELASDHHHNNEWTPIVTANRICPLATNNEQAVSLDEVRLSLMATELQLLYTELKLLTEKHLLVTDRSPVPDIVKVKTRLDLLLDRVRNYACDYDPWELHDHHDEARLSTEDYINWLSLKARLIFLDVCLDTLLPWLHAMNPSDRYYTVLLQTIQTLAGVERTTFISTSGYVQ